MPIEIHNHWIDRLAVVTAVFSGLALYPQVYTAISLGLTEGISTATYGIIFLNSIVWLLYAMHRALFTLAISAILNTVAAGTMLTWLFLIP